MGKQRKLKSKTSSIFTPDDNSLDWNIDRSSSSKSKATRWILILPFTCMLAFVLYHTTRRNVETGLANDIDYDKNWIFPLSGDFGSQIDEYMNHVNSRKSSKRIGKRNSYQTKSSEADQRKFLQKYGNKCYPSKNHDKTNSLLDRFNELHSQSKPTSSSLATQIWKYCVLYIHGGAFIDEDTVPLESLEDILSQLQIESTIKSAHEEETNKNQDFNKVEQQNNQNIAVIKDDTHIHDGFIFFGSTHSDVAKKLLSYLVNTSDNIALVEPHFLPKRLYSIIQNDINLISLSEEDFDGKKNENLKLGLNNKRWNLLELKCRHIQPNQVQDLKHQKILSVKGSPLPQHFCPVFDGYCCSIHVPNKESPIEHNQPIFITRHPLPQFGLSFTTDIQQIALPYNLSHQDSYEGEKTSAMATRNPYISTIREIVYSRPQEDPYIPTPRMFDFLLENDCLPTDKNCHKCLRSSKPEQGSCENCAHVCKCYCDMLCNYRPPEKFIKKDLWVRLPLFRKDPGRLIPRIIHQTWFEDISKEKYPNMSRLIESWKNSGWEYVFYDDNASENFLSTHFPPEVREAYDALIPGAFKADLFRYCVLLIHGGVYADMDVLLESNLDNSIPPDVGFLTPIDEPGIKVSHRMCLWNGLLAVAPGHPIIVRVIELVVNNIRNRFTSVDYDNMLCPSPVLSVSHSVDMLFTAGPCILGSAFNDVLGRHMQDGIDQGEIDVWGEDEEIVDKRLSHERKENFIFDDPRLFMPGRTIILQQMKQDMGAHRFTLLEENMVVAATDFPDYEDRPNVKGKHYSKTRVKAGIFGVHSLYHDDNNADEVIRIFIEGM